MLLEFRVSNFRSFAGEAVLSLVADKDDSLASTNTAKTGFVTAPSVLRSAVIYGANASGKSNLIKALGYMAAVVQQSVSRPPGQDYNIQQFKLGPTPERGAATSFEVSVLVKGVRYQYGFDLSPQRIEAEWLLVYETRKPHTVFERNVDPATGEENYKFSLSKLSSSLPKLRTAWRDATRPNALFLTTAVTLNSEQLRPLFNWFVEELVVFTEGMLMSADFSNQMVTSGAGKSAITSLLNVADIGITDVRAVPKKGEHKEIHVDFEKDVAHVRKTELDRVEPEFAHAGQVGDVYFDFGDESLGTRKLYVISGPLLDIVNKGKVLVFDELDGSLHPLLVRKIIEAFHQETDSSRVAQLIFSTHDTSLLDQTLFRRDQIWVTEKHSDQSSRLVPLSDFSVRKGEALQKGYLAGRYGGVPILDPRPLADVDVG